MPDKAPSEDNHDERQRVLALENTRKSLGYKSGWLYYKCKNQNLLKMLRQLQAEGLIGSMASAYASPQPEYTRNLLTIELVPKTCWFTNVRSEVSEEDWRFLKEETFVPARFVCEVCRERGPEHPVECHELWHYDDQNHVQTLTGLMALCPACHEVKHIGFAKMHGRLQQATNHLAKVNQWSPEQAEDYIAAQFAQWKQRSQCEWKLNITWLDRFAIKPRTQS